MRVFWTALICLTVDFAGYRARFEAEPAEWLPLQGRWEIVSVSRDGEMDPAQVGATLAFAGDTVAFEPRHFYIGWNDLILREQSISTLLTSTTQGTPAAIPDGTS